MRGFDRLISSLTYKNTTERCLVGMNQLRYHRSKAAHAVLIVVEIVFRLKDDKLFLERGCLAVLIYLLTETVYLLHNFSVLWQIFMTFFEQRHNFLVSLQFLEDMS